MTSFYSNGKLLLTGEYVVLNGAKAFALPTKFGQSLHIKTTESSTLLWQSLTSEDTIWFEAELTPQLMATSFIKEEDSITKRLFQILIAAKQLNPGFLTGDTGYSITSKLDFPKNWGLGSSSTLINNIANWAKVDAYKLLELTFEGSGYDIACAQHNSAITYQKTKNSRHINPVNFGPPFAEHLYFVHLNKKRKSSDAIRDYKNLDHASLNITISQISELTEKIIECQKLSDFQELIEKHETIISELIKEPTVKQQLFSDYNGSVKSLGAWGGDFILAVSKENPLNYFNSKGYQTIIPFSEMILK